MPGMFCSGGVDRRGCRLGRWSHGVRRVSRSFSQRRKGGAAASIDAREESGLALDQFDMIRRRSGELGPVEFELQGVKDIIVNRARVS